MTETPSIRRLCTGVLLAVLMVVFTSQTVRAEEPLDTLVITGAAPYGYHPWKSNMKKIEKRMQPIDRIRMERVEFRGLDEWREWDGSYDEYDAVVIIYYWAQAPEAELKALDRYVEEGGALVVAHSALAGFWKQERFDHLTGIAYRENAPEYGYSLSFTTSGERVLREPGDGNGSTHAPIRPFRIHTHDGEHPIMRGIPKTWMQAEDELYYHLRGPDTGVHVLAVAEAPDGELHPQAWVRRHGGGRVYCLTPGHHAPGASSVGFITLLARGIEWSATGNVTIPVPQNFPGPDQPVTEVPRFAE